MTKPPESVRLYLSEIAKRNRGRPKRVSKAESKARAKRMASARAAITPEAIARRTATRLANLARKKDANR